MGSAGQLVSDYLKDMIDREEQRRQRLESRASIVLSFTTAVIAITFTSLRFALDKDHLVLQGGTRWYLYSALLLYVLAVILSLYVLVPHMIEVSVVEDLEHYLEEDTFDEPEEYVDRRLALARKSELSSLIRASDVHNAVLLVSQLCLSLGVVLVAVAISYLFT